MFVLTTNSPKPNDVIIALNRINQEDVLQSGSGAEKIFSDC